MPDILKLAILFIIAGLVFLAFAMFLSKLRIHYKKIAKEYLAIRNAVAEAAASSKAFDQAAMAVGIGSVILQSFGAAFCGIGIGLIMEILFVR